MSGINQRIFIIIKKLKLKQKLFAQKTGINESTLSDLKKNKYEPSAQTIIKISEIFNVNLNWLLTGKGKIFLNQNPPSLEKELELLKKLAKIEHIDLEILLTILNCDLTKDEKAQIKKLVDFGIEAILSNGKIVIEPDLKKSD